MATPRFAQRWPAGFPGDGGPLHAGDGLWFPEVFHEPFNPPDYNDWLRHNPHDYRDRLYHPDDIELDTGLPPSHHQGRDYIPGPWRYTNGSNGRGDILRWNEPPLPHPHGKKRRLAFVWPSDGKRKHTWGRWKDILSSRGPDIFVTKHGDRPSRNQWRNNFMDWTPEDQGFNTHIDVPWARRREPYDFRERRYRRKEHPGDIFWSDATWPRRGADHYKHPLNYRYGHGGWYNMTWAPFGGTVLEGYNSCPPRNRGIFA